MFFNVFSCYQHIIKSGFSFTKAQNIKRPEASLINSNKQYFDILMLDLQTNHDNNYRVRSNHEDYDAGK